MDHQFGQYTNNPGKTRRKSREQKKNLSQSKVSKFRTPAFWGTRLVNIPTTNSIGKKDLLFRISHRYYSPANSGYETYFGINGPASIYLSLGYGITDQWSVTAGHSNLLHEWELSSKLVFWNCKKSYVSAAVNAGVSWITQEQFRHDNLLVSENFRYTGQLIVSYQPSDVLALLVAPGYATTTEYWENTTDGVFALGAGGRCTFWGNNSVIFEWVPILSGYKNQYNSYGIGLESKVGGHVFQLFIGNSVGLTTDQYLPGGDLLLEDNEYRFGFNIFRTFWF